MISGPQYSKTKLKFIQLSQVEDGKMLCVMVLDGNIIKNKIIAVEEEIDSETVLKLNILFNSTLNGLTLEEINLGTISRMNVQAGDQQQIAKMVLEAVAEAMTAEDDLQIYTSGATNIFKYPELSDSQRASELISTLEEKQLLTKLLPDLKNEEDGIQIYIGDETPVQTMKDCSVVTATYELKDGVKGTIGVIGPKRMDYEKVVETLKNVKTQLSNVYRTDKDNNSEE